ncbi:MAG: serine hydrolase [Planctomycetes bacterium]|nr:serine hydrolase [Planctomycetota bacterium]
MSQTLPAAPLAFLAAVIAFTAPTRADEPAPAAPAALDPAELARYRAAADYSQASAGEATLVMKGGRVVFEAYYNGHAADTPHLLASGTKSFSGAIAAAAVEDGLLTWDERVAATLVEWKDHPQKSRITVRHLLGLTSGLDAGTIGRPPTYADALAARSKHEPGARFEYGPVPFQVFGELMKRKLAAKKENAVDYLRRRVLDPIDCRVAIWRCGADGNPQLPSGAFLTAREWAKFGQWLLQRGRWGDRQLVAWEQLAECLKPGAVNRAYGLSFWLRADADLGRITEGAVRRPSRRSGESPTPDDFFMAAGKGKQRLYVLPARGLVVVHFADSLSFSDGEFLSRLLGTARPTPTPAPSGDSRKLPSGEEGEADPEAPAPAGD